MLGAIYRGEIYRIEDPKGIGPYKSMDIDALLNMRQGRYNDPAYKTYSYSAPSPHSDFSKDEYDNIFLYGSNYRFGFPSIDALRAWFPQGPLFDMEQLGFKVYRTVDNTGTALISETERQVAFIPPSKMEEVPWGYIHRVEGMFKLCDKWGIQRFAVPDIDAHRFMLKRDQLAVESSNDWAIYQTPKHTIILNSDEELTNFITELSSSFIVPVGYYPKRIIGGEAYGKPSSTPVYMNYIDRVQLLTKSDHRLLSRILRGGKDSCTEQEEDLCDKFESGLESIVRSFNVHEIPFTIELLHNSIYCYYRDTIRMLVPFING